MKPKTTQNRTFVTRKGKFDHKSKFGDKKKKWRLESDEIERLKARYDEIKPADVSKFTDLPLSQKTQKGLKEAGYLKPTEIQREAIGRSLQGHDILGAAKTGSGKTLAFLIPVLEGLYQHKWNQMDGMGALIITPTRELAYQIFEVLRKMGKHHDFSAGLVIGGKKLKEEAERIHHTNIVICTPGRLLQHMDETAYFHADNLKYLVLDEADRILDLGFAQSMNAIIENLPNQRQTLLFSATQTKSVKDLARLSLESPMYVSVHEHSAHSTPAQLTQSLLVCPAEDKVDLLWSFLMSHTKTKILVFLASCKQVRYVHESFRRLRPPFTILALHGAMQQLKRVDVYDNYCRKQNCVLLATDIAARGLDFPAVNWVVQVDCPEDANTYIHRAGRTARYEQDGEALLVLTPSEEEGMTQLLADKKIPINKIRVNPNKTQSIQGKLMSQCAADVQLKEFAQRAFQSYLKSIFFMSEKSVFDVTKLDAEKYATSLGLAVTPRVRFLQKEQKRQQALLLKQKQLQQQKDAGKKPAKLTKAPSGSQKEKIDDDLAVAKLKLAAKDNASKQSVEAESDSSDEEDESEHVDSSNEESDSSVSDEDNDKEDKKSVKKRTENEDKKGVIKSLVDREAKFDFSVDGEEEEEEDFLTVKRRDVSDLDTDIKDEDIEPILEASSKKDKRVTKAALAKRAMKKNLQVNTKVTFDEEGEKVVDVHREQQAVNEGEDEYEGGIQLAEAKQRMQQEDQFDKQLYRQKIKQRHREERRKEKEKRRAAKGQQKKRPDDEDEDEVEAFLGSGDDDDQGSVEFDMDPDKYFGPAKDGSDEEQESDSDDDDQAESDGDDEQSDDEQSDEDDDDQGSEESSDSEDDEPPPKKKARSSKGSMKPVPVEDDRDLVDDELMALKLLQG